MLVRKILTALLLPPAGPLLVALFGLLLARRRPRLGRALIAFALVSLFALSMPVVSHQLFGLLKDYPAIEDAKAKEAQAIVILSGGMRRNALEYGGDTVGQYSLERARYGARLARRAQLPVLVTGGIVFNGEPEAELMRKTLEQEFQVPVRWVESSSRTTAENAENSAALLKAAGIERVLLVTHAFHMERAVAAFTSAGLQTIPAPTHVHNPNPEREPFALWLMPNATSLRDSAVALHELLGNLAQRFGL